MRKQLIRLLDVPAIDDPVDRRNAPVLQVMLAVIVVAVPATWLHRIVGTEIPWRPGETAALLSSLLLSLVAASCLTLIRMGHFRWAVRQLLLVAAALMLFAYWDTGISAQTYEQPLHVMWMFVAGMMIGRRALWMMYAVLCLALVLGGMTEAIQQQETLDHLLADAVIRSLMFLLIATVVDRSTAALRNSLREANEREQQLQLANQRLSEEMAARERAQAQVVHAKKVEAVGRMASGVAHDFNHLLTLVLGYASRGLAQSPPADVRETLEGIRAAAQRATLVTGKLLSFSRMDDARVETFDACEALCELRQMLRQTLGAGASLLLQTPDTPCLIRFDRARFALMILNFCSNSADAMPQGGRFTIKVAMDTPDTVMIELKDTGNGIPEDLRERVFEPFFTTKPSGQGTGLGLALAAGLVEEAGGSIALVDSSARGTTFRLELPSANPAPSEMPARLGPSA